MTKQMDDIKTYSTAAFQDRFLAQEEGADPLFRLRFPDFFCFRLEEVVAVAALPIPPSREECFNLLAVERGGYHTRIDFRKYYVTAGDLIVLRPGDVFTVDAVDSGTSGYICHFPPDWLSAQGGSSVAFPEVAELSMPTSPHMHLDPGVFTTIGHLLGRLHELYTSATTIEENLLRAYLSTLMLEVNCLNVRVALPASSAARRLTARFGRLIRQHIDLPGGAGAYAKRLHVSSNHLNKSVREVLGCSATTLLSNRRIDEAKCLLYQTNLPVAHIATRVGFADAAYFIRRFRQLCGYTPRAYRKMIETS